MQILHRRGHHRGGWTPPAGLLGWWYGNSLTDSKWTDRSGNGRHATLYGSPSLGSNGLPVTSTKYAQHADGYIIQRSALTMMGWFNVSAAAQYSAIISADYTSPYLATLRVRATGTTDKLSAVVGGTEKITTQSFVTSEWHHFAATLSVGVLTQYYDGSQIKQDTGMSSGTPNSDALLFGRDHAAGVGRYLTGTITDIIVADNALSAAVIADVIANSPGRPS